MIKTVVLNPLPYAEPERIVVLWEVNPEGNQDRVSVPTFQDWQKEARSLESIAAFRQVDFTYAGSGEPRNVPGVRATPDLFRIADTPLPTSVTKSRRRKAVSARARSSPASGATRSGIRSKYV